jgi:pectate lyase
MYLDVLSERQGWGKDVTGGKDGAIYTVTTTADSGPGSLREAWESDIPAWIQFGVPGSFKGTFQPKGNKTLDARLFPGQVRIFGGNKTGAKLDGANNTIILGVNFDDQWADYTRDTEGADGITARNVSGLWLHHCRLAQWSDGAIDCKENVKNVTVSWCKIEKDFQAFLWMAIGATLCYSYSSKVARRMPKSVGGRVHSYNNVIEAWKDIEIQCARDNGLLLSEYNLWVPSGFNKVGSVVNGGKIQNVGHKTYGSVVFSANQLVSSTFASESRARAKMIKTPNDALRDKIKAEAGLYKIVMV